MAIFGKDRTRKRVSELLARVQVAVPPRPAPVSQRPPGKTAHPPASPQGKAPASRAQGGPPRQTPPQRIGQPPRRPGAKTPPLPPPVTMQVLRDRDAAVPPAKTPSSPVPPPSNDTMSTTLDARLEALEDRVKDLRELSEVLSVKYNPFLGLEEAGSEDGHDAGMLLRHQVGGVREDPALDAAMAMVMDTPAPRQGAVQVQEPKPGRENGAVQDKPAVPAPPPPPREGIGGGPFSASGPGAAPGERALFHARGSAVGGPRESFLAMHWFTFLSDGTDPSIIFHYLDYYRYAGWIDDENHAWLYRLAEGVSIPKTGASWADYGMDTQRLSEKHLRNLRFLDKLLGTTLQHGEADYLQQTIDMLLEE